MVATFNNIRLLVQTKKTNLNVETCGFKAKTKPSKHEFEWILVHLGHRRQNLDLDGNKSESVLAICQLQSPVCDLSEKRWGVEFFGS